MRCPFCDWCLYSGRCVGGVPADDIDKDRVLVYHLRTAHPEEA